MILEKKNYGAPGTTEFRKNMLMATAPLTEKFGVTSQHMVHRVGGGQEGDQKSFEHVQRIITGVIERVKEAKKRAKDCDWLDICTLAKLEGNLSSDDCAKWWDTSEINIFDDWERCDLDQVVAWQYSINKRFSQEDRITSGWLKEFMYASSTNTLRNAAATKYEDIEERARGGVTYTYLILCEMFEMSREVKASMIAFIECFKRRGIANYP